MFGTSFNRVPTSGTARFSGFSSVGVADTATAEGALLIGTANISVNFATGATSGVLADFHGQRNGADVRYAGTIGLNSGNLAGLRANDRAVSYSGTLAGDGNTLIMSPTDIAAKFLKTPVAAFAPHHVNQSHWNFDLRCGVAGASF